MNIELRKKNVSNVREEGFVPGIIYGHNIEPTKVKANYSEIMREYSDNGLTMSFEVKLNNESHVVFFKEIQKDKLNPKEFLHFDLMKVSNEDIMTASIPVHLTGRDEIEKSGLIVQLLSDTLEFEFPVNKGISSVDVDITNLSDGDSILASDIKIPDGFVLSEDPSKVVVNITHPKLEAAEDDGEDVTDAEPTVEEVE